MNQSIFNHLERFFCSTLTETVGGQREVPTAASVSLGVCWLQAAGCWEQQQVLASSVTALREASDTGPYIYQCYRSCAGLRSQDSLGFVSRWHAAPNYGIHQSLIAASITAHETGAANPLSSKDYGSLFMTKAFTAFYPSFVLLSTLSPPFPLVLHWLFSQTLWMSLCFSAVRKLALPLLKNSLPLPLCCFLLCSSYSSQS